MRILKNERLREIFTILPGNYIFNITNATIVNIHTHYISALSETGAVHFSTLDQFPT